MKLLEQIECILSDDGLEYHIAVDQALAMIREYQALERTANIGKRVWVCVGEEARFPEHGTIIAFGHLNDGDLAYYVVDCGDGEARVVMNGDYSVL